MNDYYILSLFCKFSSATSDGLDLSSEYCATKQQGLKPPQETNCLLRSEIENKLPNKQTMRPVGAEAFEESSKFGHCIHPRSQQNITKMRPEGRSNEYTNEHDDSKGVRKSR